MLSKIYTKINIKHLTRNLSGFVNRHIGINEFDEKQMLEKINVSCIDDLIKKSTFIEKNVSLNKLPEPISETQALTNLKSIMSKNIANKSFIGLGYHNTLLPFPIKRHILENAKWYTAYTPYQAEISQGRLESQYNFQLVTQELTGLPVANAGLLDEGSSSVEALNLMHSHYRKKRNTFLVSDTLHPQTLDILRYKAKIMDINLLVLDFNELDNNSSEIDFNDLFGIMFQYPNTYGNISIHQNLINKCKENKVLVSCIADLLSLVKLATPKEIGADIAFGNAQRFGVPLWFGGPHPTYFAVDHKLIRFLPGRIIGKSFDINGNEGYRLGLQTREQHIRRDKATSNICTAQSLLTNVVSMYSVYHGKEGLINIYENIHELTNKLDRGFRNLGVEQLNENYFDTVHIKHELCHKLYEELLKENMVLRKINDNELVINLDETTGVREVNKILSYTENLFNLDFKNTSDDFKMDKNLLRTSNFMEQDLFRKYNSETELLRYIHKLAEKDYTLCDGMIPLGSCTMKLTSCSEMEALSFPELTDMHPYVPSNFNEGYLEMIDKIGDYLKEITGFEAVSFQSNSGSMGEYLGLLVIKKYFDFHNKKKDIVLIPNSAHGTNFASANLANMRLLKYDDDISLVEFTKLVNENKDELACLMVTYPNTNGVFQKNINEICDIIHNAGGLVYMDGANMNAQVGITNPALSGSDVCHLNLHKTFCIPHGGGGPGMGPILCNGKLKDFLPMNELQVSDEKLSDNRVGNITSSQWSSASILSIPYMYISMMGEEGLRKATQTAILNANYLKAHLNDYYTIKDVNENGLVGHEFIIDTMEFRKIGITESDIAKRLIDYSFHPPTMSWPRGGVLMFEPTESESKKELDRLIEALISIRNEIKEVEDGKDDLGNEICKDNNVLKNAPHNFDIIADEWKYPYNFKKAFYPVSNLKNYKFNIPIGRINDIEGDKSLLKNKN